MDIKRIGDVVIPAHCPFSPPHRELVVVIVPTWMGRARRNQRDAIRKQRAKRRRRGGLDNSDGSDSDTDNTNIDDVSIDRLEAILAASATVAPTNIVTIIDHGKETTNDGPTTTSSDKKQGKGTKFIVAKKVGKSTSENDRIERMRFKKQQFKARRKEKKEARETAAATRK